MLYYLQTPYGPQLVQVNSAPAAVAHYGAAPLAAPASVSAAPPGPVSHKTAASLLTNPRFVQGALMGAAAAYLLSNDSVQQAAIKTMVQTWSVIQGGVEELKERFRDAEAELHAGPPPSED